jgi:predicted phage terminase large subunit-like protein
MAGEPVSLQGWAKRYLPHYISEQSCNFHGELFAELNTMRDERGQRLLVIAPRGSAKSTCTSVVFALHAICEGYEPYIVLGAESADQARHNLTSIKHELVHNPLIAQDYPNAVGHSSGRTWNDGSIISRNGVMVDALGSRQNIRGRRKGEQRPTLIVMDDPDSDDSIYSEAIRERVKDRFFASWMKAGEPATNVVVIGTLVHQECLVSHLRTMPGWRGKHIYRSVISWPDRMDLWEDWERLYHDDEAAAQRFYEAHEAELLEGAEVLWPAREPLLALMKTRAQDGVASFAREKQNEPLPPEGTRFDSRWFEGEDLWWDELPIVKAQPAAAFAVLDPATGKHKTRGDYPAIVWCWFLKGDRHLYIDADIERRPMPQTIEVSVRLAAEHRFNMMGCEANGFQTVFAGNLQDAMVGAGYVIPVQPIDNRENKFQRIDRLGPFLQSRNFKFKRGSRGAARLVRQLQHYSNPAVDKLDGPDALEMLVRLVRDSVTR